MTNIFHYSLIKTFVFRYNNERKCTQTDKSARLVSIKTKPKAERCYDLQFTERDGIYSKKVLT